MQPSGCSTYSTMDRKRSKKAKSLRAARPRQGRLQNFVTLPVQNPVPVYRFSRRYQINSVAAAGDSFTIEDGHKSALVRTGTTSAVCIFDVWRIRKISMYLSGDNKTASLTAVASDVSSNFQNTRERTMQLATLNDSQSVRGVWTPESPFDPLFAWHHTTTTNVAGQLMVLSTSSGTGLYIDIEFEGVPNFTGLPNGYVAVIGSGVNNGLLAVSAIFNSKLVPIGINVA